VNGSHSWEAQAHLTWEQARHNPARNDLLSSRSVSQASPVDIYAVVTYTTHMRGT
jgi:hypothetical protein